MAKRPVSSDDPRGHLVRPYAMTAGRSTPAVELAVEALVRATRKGIEAAGGTGRDRRMILQLCSDRVQSLAELAARMSRPIGVTRILIAELVELGLLEIEDAAPADGGRLDVALLERVLHGLHKL